jgi:hypothetical protein
MEVRPTLANISRGSGCKYCKKTGIDLAAKGIIYLIQNPDLQAVKIGISSVTARKKRIATHEKNGWKLLGSWNVKTGTVALSIEQIVIHHWRTNLGAPAAISPLEMPQGGFSETASLLFVDPEEELERVNRLVKELGSID